PNPAVQILALLAVCIGLPYFVLSTTGPLLQHWFSRANPGISPFRLYAMSNLGSMLALLSFPILVEPHLTRPQQATCWGWGLATYAIACGLCAGRIWMTRSHGMGDTPEIPVNPSGALSI